ncbi:MAG: inorganic phosphate transporter [Gammaproteobacteria bacterium]|nr:inorganic phosphate transporter [Gammaproteobacteria bacterium]MBU2056359.1 inorganic phosphate transporter [Gammaproteobacteria bacterium]MBU2177252.1 inorganic phosphate transporter [Gammaproteobacteria bacterium]MBU2246154.1 inorganic phosphate transporter [Gammaproteobacteria bacterium]MBU2343002.1 inorganic phosphate transporter [Gammaproteobacteria bacterium]
MDILTTYGYTLIIVAAVFGFIMAYGVGANDVANAMGTSVGSKALTVKQAIFIAAIFEFAGAYLAGGSVTSTIRSGIVDPIHFASAPELMVFGMIAALLAAGTWLLVASYYGWPVSTTHSIVGAIIGFAAVGVGVDAVEWGKVGGIVGSWIVTPVLAGILAYLIFMSAQRLIFDTENPLANAKKYVPFYMALAALMMALVTVTKGLKHVGLDLTVEQNIWICGGIALAVGVIGKIAINRVHIDPQADKEMHFNNVEKIFGILMITTACCMAFAHGSNDVANAIGPLAAVVSVIQSGGEVVGKAKLDWWILPLGAVGIVIGLATLGAKVIKTIGTAITHLTPSRGFAAELSAATTVVIASGTGLPISTTQTLVGAVLGVGLARGIAALNLGVVRNIFISWVVTLPVGAGLAIVFFYMIKAIFSV